MPRPDLNGAAAALSHRDFRRFWFGALVSNTGGWMQNAAVPVVAFNLSGRPGDVGITGFFQYVPFMVMGLVGGALADRYPRRRLLILTQIAQAVFALGLFALVASGSATTTSLSVLAFGAGLAGGLNVPIWQSFVTELVPRDTLLNAVTLNSAQFNAARALGPFLAGVVIAGWGAQWAFALNASSYFVVIGVLIVIRGTSDGRVIDTGQRFVARVRAGAQHLRSSPPIVACCVAIVAVAGLGSPLFSYLPVIGTDELGIDGAGLGLLFGAAGAGSVLFTPMLLTVAPRLRRSLLLAGSMTLYGGAVVASGLAPSFPLAVVALLAFGGAYLSIASTINTTIQLVVDEKQRGIVIALYIGCLTGALPVGIFVWGLVADRVGIRPTTVGAGVALLLATAALVVTRRFEVMGTVTEQPASSPG